MKKVLSILLCLPSLAHASTHPLWRMLHRANVYEHWFAWLVFLIGFLLLLGKFRYWLKGHHTLCLYWCQVILGSLLTLQLYALFLW